QALGSRGGHARAKKLSSEQRKKIASLGGMVRAINSRAIDRIESNMAYVSMIRELRPPPEPKSISRTTSKLPGAHANTK
ncbi:MAG: hypothetical protein JNK65_00905, partial [Deltaproteobacteria bacterium]|nr:hypothetical protein [Deltaproteobacteria bacterium]